MREGRADPSSRRSSGSPSGGGVGSQENGTRASAPRGGELTGHTREGERGRRSEGEGEADGLELGGTIRARGELPLNETPPGLFASAAPQSPSNFRAVGRPGSLQSRMRPPFRGPRSSERAGGCPTGAIQFENDVPDRPIPTGGLAPFMRRRSYTIEELLSSWKPADTRPRGLPSPFVDHRRDVLDSVRQMEHSTGPSRAKFCHKRQQLKCVKTNRFNFSRSGRIFRSAN